MLLKLVGGPYQGNAEWTGFGACALLMSAAAWWRAREASDPERKSGGRTAAVFFLLFAVMALAQVLSHPGAW